MKRCWSANAADRPTMVQVIAYLRMVIDHLNTEEAKNQVTGKADSKNVQSFEAMDLTLAKPSIPLISLDQVNSLVLETSSHPLSGLRVAMGILGGTRVSVQIFDKSNEEAQHNFANQMEIFKAMRCPALPTALAYSLLPQNAIICESLQGESVRNFLQSPKEFSLDQAVQLLFECAKSMTVLHTWSPALLHRNVSSRVFKMQRRQGLLDSSGLDIEIGDLSFARFYSSVHPPVSNLGAWEEPEYCAPECFNPSGLYSEKSDVFSFAIVIWEVTVRCLFGKYVRPYLDVEDKSDVSFMNEIVRNNKRPAVSADCQVILFPNLLHAKPISGCPAQLLELMETSWSPNALARPCFADLANNLSQYLSTLRS